MNNKVEAEFIYCGYRSVVVMTPGCWRCGYIDVPTTHPQYKRIASSNADIQCHEGITYTSTYLRDVGGASGIWIGFDAAHLLDAPDFETGLQYFDDELSQKSIHAQQECFMRSNYNNRHVWTLEEMITECRRIIDQLVEMSK